MCRQEVLDAVAEKVSCIARRSMVGVLYQCGFLARRLIQKSRGAWFAIYRGPSMHGGNLTLLGNLQVYYWRFDEDRVQSIEPALMDQQNRAGSVKRGAGNCS